MSGEPHTPVALTPAIHFMPLTYQHDNNGNKRQHKYCICLRNKNQPDALTFSIYFSNSLHVSNRLTNHHQRGRDSSVGIATRYGLDGPGIESRWGRDFPHTSRPALGPTQPPVQMGTGSFPGVKRPGSGADPPTHIFSAEVKKE